MARPTHPLRQEYAIDSQNALELRHGPLRLALRPDLGGCIAGLWHDDRPVLRSTDPRELSVSRPSGCFPLVPYSNRVADCSFTWRDERFTTVRNIEGSPHSVHGVGWMRPWSVASCNGREATLTLDHPGDEHWPFAFEASQRFSLGDEALDMELRVTSKAKGVAPFGLGWHPYFPKRSRSRLHVEVAARWDNDAGNLPVRRVAQHAIDADVSHLAYDNCFEGWRGAARIRDEALAVALTSSMPYVVVFTPPERDYFCVEPVSHLSNAINMPEREAHGVQALAPGESAAAWMRLEISDVHR